MPFTFTSSNGMDSISALIGSFSILSMKRIWAQSCRKTENSHQKIAYIKELKACHALDSFEWMSFNDSQMVSVCYCLCVVCELVSTDNIEALKECIFFPHHCGISSLFLLCIINGPGYDLWNGKSFFNRLMFNLPSIY